MDTYRITCQLFRWLAKFLQLQGIMGARYQSQITQSGKTKITEAQGATMSLTDTVGRHDSDNETQVICLPSASGPWCFQRCFPYLQSPAPPSQRAHRSHPWFWPAAHSAGGPLDWGLSCWRPTTQGTSRVNCILMSGTWRRNYRVRCKGMQTFAVISFKDG